MQWDFIPTPMMPRQPKAKRQILRFETQQFCLHTDDFWVWKMDEGGDDALHQVLSRHILTYYFLDDLLHQVLWDYTTFYFLLFLELDLPKSTSLGSESTISTYYGMLKEDSRRCGPVGRNKTTHPLFLGTMQSMLRQEGSQYFA